MIANRHWSPITAVVGWVEHRETQQIGDASWVSLRSTQPTIFKGKSFPLEHSTFKTAIMSLRKLKRSKQARHQTADPDAAEQLFIQGNAHKRQGHPAAAEACFRAAVTKDPGHGQAWNNLGNLLHDQNKLPEALACYRRACAILTDNAVCLYNYGSCLHASGDWLAAEPLMAQATALDPAYTEAFIELGAIRRHLGDPAGAAAALAAALCLEPDSCPAYRLMGLVLKDQGRMEAARASLRQGLEFAPDDALSRYLLTRYQKYTNPDDADITVLKDLLGRPDPGRDNAILLHFALGKIYDDLARHQLAWHHYQLANQLKRDSLGVGWIATGIELHRYRRIFQPSLFKRFARAASCPSELPVFIVGMPRSGTTLVEQICASHSLAQGRGELKKITQLIKDLPDRCKGQAPYPECLLTATPSLLYDLAQQYVAELATGLPAGTSRIIDKMPANFQELGLITILFPQARIIHCRRDPLDTCLSNYFQNFEEGNECSYDLETLAFYYRKYLERMALWETVLAIKIHTVQYEALVSNPEAESKALIEFLGLDWEPGCLDFHQSRRNVQTSSDWQVRQPIYRQSVGRWKSYEPYIGELIQGLGKDGGLI